MTDDNKSLGNPTLLTLFQSETESHTAALNRTLLELQKDLHDTSGADALVRAAHAIHGAARIVHIEMSIKLSHAMEDIFVAIRDRKCSPDEKMIDTLLAGTDVLKKIGTFASNDTVTELMALSPEVDAAVASLVFEPNAETDNTETANRKETPDAPPLIDLSNPKMLALFQSELETHTITLNEGLLLLEKDSSDTDTINSLMRAAHSIKGASRIINIDMAVKLAHAMEDVFVAAQNEELSLTPEIAELLFLGTDVLENIGKAASVEKAASLSAYVDDAATLTTSIASAKSGKVSTPNLCRKDNKEDTQQENTPQRAGVLRVSTEHIGHMINLAGEIMVRGKRFNHFTGLFKDLEKQLSHLGTSIRHVHQMMNDADRTQKEQMADVMHKTTHIHAELSKHINAFDHFAFDFDILSNKMHEEAMASRMRPFSDGTIGFPRMVRDISKSIHKEVSFEMLGQNTTVDRNILNKLEPPITHLLRNALDHGLEDAATRTSMGKPACGKLTLEARHHSGRLLIIVKDDGRGIDIDTVRNTVVQRKLTNAETASQLSDDELLQFMFLPGFTTSDQVTELSGRGVGLNVVSEMLRTVNGTVQISTGKNNGTQIRLLLPLSLSVVRSLIFELNNESYAFPLSQIEFCMRVERGDIIRRDSHHFVISDGIEIHVLDGRHILDLPHREDTRETLTAIVIENRNCTFGFIVDRCVGEFDLVIKPLDPRLGTTPCLSSTSIMEDGKPVISLDVEDTLLMAEKRVMDNNVYLKPEENTDDTRKRILIVEDSMTVREMERILIAEQGYAVDVAVDGMDGWNALTTAQYDLIVTDIDMPRMNGLELIEKLRADSRFEKIPIIVVSYKDSQEDRDRGIRAGADRYMTKNSFHDDSIIKTINTLLEDDK
ncbi:MAG: response regulator [Phycisphaerae bacterium]|nr:response regulator [Phycisphaerae bacterium]